MPVFFVHDIGGKGLVTPLDRKFRVRDIPPTEEINEIPKIHPKNESSPNEYESSAEREKNATRSANQQAAQYYQQSQTKAFTNLGRVKDIMSSPVLTITQDKSLEDAWRIMQKYEIHHLLIVNAEKAYCGMLSEKKIVPFLMSSAIASNKKRAAENSEQDPEQGFEKRTRPENTPLSVFCQETLLSTHPNTLVSDLSPALLEYGLDGIAVTDNGEIVGMVTYSDILKIILKTQAFEVEA